MWGPIKSRRADLARFAPRNLEKIGGAAEWWGVACPSSNTRHGSVHPAEVLLVEIVAASDCLDVG
jgi:hypothetical protein